MPKAPKKTKARKSPSELAAALRKKQKPPLTVEAVRDIVCRARLMTETAEKIGAHEARAELMPEILKRFARGANGEMRDYGRVGCDGFTDTECKLILACLAEAGYRLPAPQQEGDDCRKFHDVKTYERFEGTQIPVPKPFALNGDEQQASNDELKRRFEKLANAPVCDRAP